MFILDVSGTVPLVRERVTQRPVAQSSLDFFKILKQGVGISPSDAFWCGMCMSYLIALECSRLRAGINSTALSKRGDAVAFPFAEGSILGEFHKGMRIGEEVLLRGRKDGEEHAMRELATRLCR